MRAGVREVLALEPDLRTALLLSQALGQVERSRAANELLAVEIDLRLERRISAGLSVSSLELVVRSSKGLRDVTATVIAEVGVRGSDALAAGGGGRVERRHLRDHLRAHVSRLVLGASLELGDVRLEGGRALSRRRGGVNLVNGVQDGRTHDHRVRHGRDLLNGLRRSDPEAHRERQVGLRAHAADKGAEVLRDALAAARHAGDGNGVDEARGGRGEVLDALVRRGRRDQRHEREFLALAGRDQRLRLLRRQVDDDETVHASVGGLLDQLIHPVLEHRVVVAHQNHGGGEAAGAGGLDKGHALLDAGAELEGDLVGGLDGGAVGLGVAERHAQLNDVRAALLHGEEELHRVVWRRVARGHERHERRLVALAAAGERGVKARRSGRRHGDGGISHGRHRDATAVLHRRAEAAVGSAAQKRCAAGPGERARAPKQGGGHKSAHLVVS
mmetsp:Transcript_22541/g.52182  ORF Transcript_22541/g.52182 Transcript_22541/m.52182 type:complete len:445 (-) Transcript_22541:38-1372(-)